MGKEFTAVLVDGSQRFAASMSNHRADLFVEVARLLERYVGRPSGIEEDNDEYRIDAPVFIGFFEAVHAAEWITYPRGFLHGWAAHAAGMIQNITLTERTWTCRDGTALPVWRYLRDDELSPMKPNRPPKSIPPPAAPDDERH